MFTYSKDLILSDVKNNTKESRNVFSAEYFQAIQKWTTVKITKIIDQLLCQFQGYILR